MVPSVLCPTCVRARNNLIDHATIYSYSAMVANPKEKTDVLAEQVVSPTSIAFVS